MVTMYKKTTVPALDRGLDIIELVVQREALSFSEIVKILKLPTASTARILKCLCERNYLTKDAEGLYLPGSALHNLIPGKNKSQQLLTAAAPVLKQLRDQTSQTAILFYWDGQVWECIGKELHENSINMQTIGETRVDIFNYPWGCFAYAQLQKDKRKLTYGLDAKLKANLEKTLTEFKKNSCVVDSGKNLHRLAVPIFDSEENLLGALALGILPPEMKNIGKKNACQLLIEGREKIEKAME